MDPTLCSSTAAGNRSQGCSIRLRHTHTPIRAARSVSPGLQPRICALAPAHHPLHINRPPLPLPFLGLSISLAAYRERAQPFLYIRPPEDIQLPSVNQQERTTPYDVYQTMSEVLLGVSARAVSFGSPLTKPLPQRSCAEAGVPASLCFDNKSNPTGGAPRPCAALKHPPRLQSFYADALPERGFTPLACPTDKLRLARISRRRLQLVPSLAASGQCNCSSTTLQWQPCQGAGADSGSAGAGWLDVLRLRQADDFAVVHCGTAIMPGGHGYQVLLHLSPRQGAALRDSPWPSPRQAAQPDRHTPRARLRRLEEDSGVARQMAPSVLIIEVDSLSRATANRHMPRTMEVLATHPALAQSMVDVELRTHGVVGSSSIPNQLALLTGCTAALNASFGRKHSPGHAREIGWTKTIRTDPPHHDGLNLVAREQYGNEMWCSTIRATSRKHRWLFGLAKELGYATFFGEEICGKGSPWSLDALMERSEARQHIDHFFHDLYCRIAERMELPDEKTFMASFEDCHGSANGELRFAWPLAQLRRMWRVYGRTPKFAIINTGVVHAHLRAGAHVAIPYLSLYDQLLSSFLDDFLHQQLKAGPDTLVLLHGDHGVAEGFSTVDFSTQVEHRQPWARLLIPAGLVPNASRLRTNANRLVSAFDLHETLRAALLRGAGMAERPDAAKATPQAPVDLLQSEIDPLRTCRDAGIPASLCLCEHETLPSGKSSYRPHCGRARHGTME